MPFHLELGSDGHSFQGKAIVVNSKTGHHLSHKPIPMAKAEAQKRVVEEAIAEHGEPVTGKGKPDMRRKKVKAAAPGEAVPKMKAVPAAEAKKLMAQLAERKRGRETVSAHAIEQWLERLVAIDLIEEGVVKDGEAEKYIQEKQDEGEYTELLEESLVGRGHGEVAQNIYNYFKKKGNSPKNIKESMRELIQEGYSMFEDLV